MTVIQVYAQTTEAEKAEVYQFYEDLPDLLGWKPKNMSYLSQGTGMQKYKAKIPGITGKFSLGVQNEAGQRLTKFCQENALVIENTLFQQHKRWPYTWISPNGQCQNQMITFFVAKDGEGLPSQQKQDLEPNVAQIISSLKQNSGLN